MLSVHAPDGLIWFDVGWVVVQNAKGERQVASCPGTLLCLYLCFAYTLT